MTEPLIGEHRRGSEPNAKLEIKFERVGHDGLRLSLI
jgi:hypothetical protein